MDKLAALAVLASQELKENLPNNQKMLDRSAFHSELRWEQRFEQLKLYQKNHNTTVLPSSSPLSKWARTQRRNYRSKRLDPERIAKLEAIGFQWEPWNHLWSAKYQALVEFQQKNGHTKVPGKNSSLGKWVTDQRFMKRKGLLSQDRIEKLNEIQFCWEP